MEKFGNPWFTGLILSRSTVDVNISLFIYYQSMALEDWIRATLNGLSFHSLSILGNNVEHLLSLHDEQVQRNLHVLEGAYVQFTVCQKNIVHCLS